MPEHQIAYGHLQYLASVLSAPHRTDSLPSGIVRQDHPAGVCVR